MFDKYNKVQRAVLETTLRIIIQKELQATSMALIAKESGVSTGNIYHYFKSKEEIINELYKAIVAHNGDLVIPGVKQPGTIQERFFRAWEQVLFISRKYPEGFQFIEQYSFSPYISEESKNEAYISGWCGPVDDLYQEAIDQQLFVKMDPKLMVQMHYGSIVYSVKGNIQSNFGLNAETTRQVIQACWNSVLAR
ncbi:TetR/AcrR family transcriptional regulator [Paenibacillus sp. R14(2021)]|uniref:TetR/AcrR family transcriptional regulator n=1 Tax=Paenibacillus sp. R14(2021) TaxID=2859228 RepID=UPI001C6127D3|nr:TetR/AcrR family transcriptional regulator [Paenibacillus sp. R14(2021)]